ncbi:hypothetical protein EVAR_3188_1 [Eumeta japonica]|uniref:Uncharacterized protein n=1 Tax=Eumeta variegata TaxID=151549 RepID=A0A4C1SY14_EUMVA|nr:hypothetical protein EVAR_3188_1 [Eumeta japonica]
MELEGGHRNSVIKRRNPIEFGLVFNDAKEGSRGQPIESVITLKSSQRCRRGRRQLPRVAQLDQGALLNGIVRGQCAPAQLWGGRTRTLFIYTYNTRNAHEYYKMDDEKKKHVEITVYGAAFEMAIEKNLIYQITHV